MLGQLVLLAYIAAAAIGFRVPWHADDTWLDALSPEDLDATRTVVSFQQPFEKSSRMLSQELDEFIDDIMKQWDVPGLQVAVVRRRGNSTEYDVETKAYGVRGHDQRPMRTDVSGLKMNKWMSH